jgi:PAS domain S-box-containing protein
MFEQHEWYLVGGALVVQLGVIVGLIVHLARRRRTDERSSHDQERYTAILRAIPDLMFVLRRDGTYIESHVRDPAQLFVPPDQFIGKTVRDIMPAGPAEQLMDAIDQACRGHDPVVVEYQLPMGEPRHFEARVVRVEHDRVLSVVRDITDAKRVLERNRDLAGRLIASQEGERTRIARDLHDGVCQEAAAVGMDISRLRHVRGDIQGRDVQGILLSVHARMASLAENLRQLSHGLHSSVLHHIGLIAALQAHCTEVERQYEDVEVTFIPEGNVEPASRAVALSLFRIAQEALGNAVKHGNARHATVWLSRDDRDLALAVADDGKGFDPQDARQNGGLGLVSIEERARLVQGRVSIRSEAGSGTVINVRVPLHIVDDAHQNPFAHQDDTPASRRREPGYLGLGVRNGSALRATNDCP